MNVGLHIIDGWVHCSSSESHAHASNTCSTLLILSHLIEMTKIRYKMLCKTISGHIVWVYTARRIFLCMLKVWLHTPRPNCLERLDCSYNGAAMLASMGACRPEWPPYDCHPERPSHECHPERRASLSENFWTTGSGSDFWSDFGWH